MHMNTMIRRGKGNTVSGLLQQEQQQQQQQRGGKTVTAARAMRIGHQFPRCSKTKQILSILLLFVAAATINLVDYETTTDNDTDSMDISCVESLLANKKAIIADSSMKDASKSFRILLHPRTKDNYITRRIQKRGIYEAEMENFIVRALPATKQYKSGAAAAGSENAATAATTLRPWALDLGANVGFHSLHMAKRGANVISFEPAPDTFELLQCSAKLLMKSDNEKNANSTSTTTSSPFVGGSIRVVQAGASDVESEAKMSRYPNSPGMTTFANNNANANANANATTTSFAMEALETTINATSMSTATTAGMIRLLRPQDVLESLKVPEGRSEYLRLLKVDVEVYELKALKGLNLTRFPFQYFTFEFFPELLRASGTDPVDLLVLVRDAGYECDKDPGRTRDEMKTWVNNNNTGIKGSGHVNFFCKLSD